jgi:hypothetical protein
MVDTVDTVDSVYWVDEVYSSIRFKCDKTEGDKTVRFPSQSCKLARGNHEASPAILSLEKQEGQGLTSECLSKYNSS